MLLNRWSSVLDMREEQFINFDTKTMKPNNVSKINKIKRSLRHNEIRALLGHVLDPKFEALNIVILVTRDQLVIGRNGSDDKGLVRGFLI